MFNFSVSFFQPWNRVNRRGKETRLIIDSNLAPMRTARPNVVSQVAGITPTFGL
jgi:hypothetical protein